MRTLPTGWAADLRKLHGGKPYIWLYEVVISADPDIAFRLAEWHEAVIYGGKSYEPWPVSHTGGGEDSAGRMDGVTVTVSNVDRTMQAYLEYHEYLTGKKVVIRRVKSDDLTLGSEETFAISSAASQEATVAFNLSAPFMVAGIVMGRRAYRDACAWIFKSPSCGYTGAIATCDKTLAGANGCRAHANAARFGGAPGIPQGAVIIR